MKTGFKISIQKNLSDNQKNIAKIFCNEFIIKTLSHPKMKYFGRETNGGRDTSFARNSIGYKIQENLFFRRISKKIRHFAVVEVETLNCGNEYCPCGKHNPKNVKFKNAPDFEVYAVIGDIKG